MIHSLTFDYSLLVDLRLFEKKIEIHQFLHIFFQNLWYFIAQLNCVMQAMQLWYIQMIYKYKEKLMFDEF